MGTVDVEKNMPPGADRRLLLVILVTIILVPSVFGASVYISNEVAPDLQFIPLPYHAYWTYVNSMCFYGYNEEYIAVARFDGLHIVDRYFSNVTGPIKVSNNTWHSGAYDLASSLTDELLLTTNGPNGSVVWYGKQWPTGNYTMEPFKLYNVSQDTTFRYIVRSEDASRNWIYLGSESSGIGIFRRDVRQVSFFNTSNGMPSNFVSALKIRGDYLLVGTDQGFSILERSTGKNFSCTRDEYSSPFWVTAIDYYPLTHKVFVGTNGGLLIFHENGSAADAITRLTDYQGLPSILVSCLQVDKDLKRLYVGTPRGVVYLDLESADYALHAFVNWESLKYNGVYHQIMAMIVPARALRNEIYLGTSMGYIIRVPLTFSSSSQSTAINIVLYPNLVSLLITGGLWLWYFRGKKVTDTEASHEELLGQGESEEHSRRRAKSDESHPMLRPDKPYSNIAQLGSIIRSAQRYLWWFDKFFSKEGFNMVEDMTASSVTEIRILTGLSDKINDRFRELFKRFRSQLEQAGKSASLRVITDTNLLASIHDRWIVSEDACFNTPSVDTISVGQFAEIKKTQNVPPFEEWWHSGLDIVDDWNAIMEKVKQKIQG